MKIFLPDSDALRPIPVRRPEKPCRSGANLLTPIRIGRKLKTMNATVDLQLPEGVKIADAEIKMSVAARLFDVGELSSGQAAELAGVTKREFVESVGRCGVSIFQYSAEELERDLARV